MRYLIYLTLFLSSSLSAGNILKWVDEDGKVYYGDTPPASIKTEPVSVQSAPSNPGKALPRLSAPKNTEAAPGNGTEGTPLSPTAAKTPPDQSKIACKQAKEDLEVLNRSSRIKLRSSDGTTRTLSDEEIIQRKEQAQADINRFCG